MIKKSEEIQNMLDFKAITIKYSEDENPMVIQIKEHSDNKYNDDKPLGRTLFVVNIPPYVEETNLQRLFSDIGIVDSVQLQRGIPGKNQDDSKEFKNNGFKSGYVVFKNRESLLKALTTTSLKPLKDENNKILTGLKKYIKQYNETVCNHEELHKKATKVLELYDKKQQEETQEKELVDSDGWTVVTKKGRNPGLALKESVEIRLNEKYKEQMKKRSLQNFYSFQKRDANKKKIEELRKKHEESKKVIEMMKKKRIFKPFS